MLFVEHPHVYTLGLHGNAGNLLIQHDFLSRIGASYYQTNRGGDITYHGPGQIVGYPILNLSAFCTGIRMYIHMIEEAVLQTLLHFGLQASRLEGATGVWMMSEGNPPRKICAIGVRTSRGVSMHGFAFNVNTCLDYFNHIHPCGFTDKGVTSMEKELGIAQDMEAVKKVLLEKIRQVFGMEFGDFPFEF